MKFVQTMIDLTFSLRSCVIIVLVSWKHDYKTKKWPEMKTKQKVLKNVLNMSINPIFLQIL